MEELGCECCPYSKTPVVNPYTSLLLTPVASSKGEQREQTEMVQNSISKIRVTQVAPEFKSLRGTTCRLPALQSQALKFLIFPCQQQHFRLRSNLPFTCMTDEPCQQWARLISWPCPESTDTDGCLLNYC